MASSRCMMWTAWPRSSPQSRKLMNWSSMGRSIARTTCDRLLQIVLVLSGDAHLRVLDRRLDLELLVLDRPRRSSAPAPPRSLLSTLSVILEPPLPVFSGFCSSMCLRLTLRLMSFSRRTLDGRLRAVLARRADDERLVRLLDLGLGVLEVVALGDLFVRLVQRVVELVPLHFRDDVEARHGLPPRWL